MHFATLPPISDQIIYDIWLTRNHLAAIAIAVKSNIFQLIQEGKKDTTSLANSLDMAPKGVEALCTLLAALGCLDKNVNNLELNALSKSYLTPDSDFFWGSALTKADETPQYQHLFQSLINSPQAYLSAGNKTFTEAWETGDISYEAARKFTGTMQSTIYYAALKAIETNTFDNISCLLDIGAGSGCFSGAFTQKYPNSQAIVFELPTVLKITHKYLEKFNTLDRINMLPGNFFKDQFPNTDGILFSNIFHDWQPDQVEMLIRKSFDALKPGGKIIIHEMILNNEKNGPLAAAAFNLIMYMNHRSQQFSFQELRLILKNSGFQNISLVEHHPYYSLIIAEK